MDRITDIPGVTLEYAAKLAEVGITTLEDLREANPVGVAALFDWVSNWTAGQWQAHARTALEAAAETAGNPSPAKWFLALQPLSVEAVIPNYDVPAGGKVNLWFRSDEHLEALIKERVIARIDDTVHMLATVPFLPTSAIRRLAEGSIYTVEGLLADEAIFFDKRFSVRQWLGKLAPADTVDGWLSAARDYLMQQEA